MDEDMDYISSGIGIEYDPSLSLWTFIKKAYEALDQTPTQWYNALSAYGLY